MKLKQIDSNNNNKISRSLILPSVSAKNYPKRMYMVVYFQQCCYLSDDDSIDNVGDTACTSCLAAGDIAAARAAVVCGVSDPTVADGVLQVVGVAAVEELDGDAAIASCTGGTIRATSWAAAAAAAAGDGDGNTVGND